MSRALRRMVRLDGRTLELALRAADGRLTGSLTEGEDERAVDAAAQRVGATGIRLELDGRSVRAHVVRDGETAWVSIEGRTYQVELVEPGARGAVAGGEEDFATSPMTGTLAKLSVEGGAAVAEGAELFVVEAMKMEYVVKAPRDLVVAEVRGSVGGQVEQGAVVVTFEGGDA